MLPSNDLCISYIPDLTSDQSPFLTQWPAVTLALQGFLDTSTPPIRCLHLLLPEFEQTDLCITYHSSLNLSFTPQKSSSPRLRGLPSLPLLCYVVLHRIFFPQNLLELKIAFVYLPLFHKPQQRASNIKASALSVFCITEVPGPRTTEQFLSEQAYRKQVCSVSRMEQNKGRDGLGKTQRKSETDMRERMIETLSKSKCVKPQQSKQGKYIIHLCLVICGHSTNL